MLKKILPKLASTLFNCFWRYFLDKFSNDSDFLRCFPINWHLEFSFVVWSCVFFTIKIACHFIHQFCFFFILNLQRKSRNLKLVSAIFLIKFLFFHQMIALQKLWKMFFISSKKLFLFSRYSSFCIFSSSFPHFPDSKGQMEWNN